MVIKENKKQKSTNWVKKKSGSNCFVMLFGDIKTFYCFFIHYKKILIYIQIITYGILSISKFSITYGFYIRIYYIQILYTNLLHPDFTYEFITYGFRSICNYIEIQICM